jgi:hypothetical protein
MVHIRFTVTRFAPVLQAIEQRLAPDGRLTCRLGAGRVYLVLRGAGASRWDPEVQLARALEMAATTRAMLAADPRGPVRAHASHAVVVRFEDVSVERGCEVRAHWECVVPRPAG